MIAILTLLFDPNTGLPLLLSILVSAGCIYWCRRRPSGLTTLACLFFGMATWVLCVGGGLGAWDIELCTTYVPIGYTPPAPFIKALPDLMAVAVLTTRLTDTGIWLALLSFLPRGMISKRLPMPERVTRPLRAWGLMACVVGCLWIGFGPLEQLLFRYHPYWMATHSGFGATLPCTRLERLDLHGVDLANANLRFADLSGANLNGAVLAGATLGDANLSGADLRHVDVSGAAMYRADLTHSRLEGANLAGAELTEAHLQDLRLVGLNLRGADLRAAELAHADLTNADLSECNLRGVNLAQTKLANAKLMTATYDPATRWPAGFNPRQHGAIRVARTRWRDGGSSY